MITIKAEALVKALSPIIKVVPRKSTFPILSHVYISVSKGKMRLIGGDTETEIRNEVSIDDFGTDVKFTLPAVMLNDLCKSWPKDNNVTIDLKNDKALVKCGRSRANIEMLSAQDYPLSDCDDYQFIEIDSHEFCNALARARLAINKNHTNPSLRSVSLCFEPGKLVAGGFCNEHHISESVDINSELEREILISDSSIDSLLFCASQFEQIKVGFSKNNISIKSGDLFVSTRMVDAKVVKLPDKYNNVDDRVNFSVDKQQILSVVNRALIFCQSDSVIKKALFTGKDGKLEVSALNDKNMAFNEEIESDMTAEFEVCFNLVAFEKVFSVYDNECSIFVIDEVNGVYFNTGKTVALIAGIKI